MQSTWKSALLPAFTVLLVLLATFTQAQSQQCHTCIQQTIPRVVNCTTLPQQSLTTLDKLIHGEELFNVTSDFRNGDPPAFECMVSLMWNVVHYKDTLWSSCLQPEKACIWAEMMQYLQIITKVASIYGMRTPPAAVLIDAPK